MEELIKAMVQSMPLPARLQAEVKNMQAATVAAFYGLGLYCEYCPAFHRCNNGPALIARHGQRVAVKQPTMNDLTPEEAEALLLLLLLASI